MTNEEWRAVVGYEGYYEVSDQGRMRSVTRTVVSSNGKRRRFIGQALRPTRQPDGYLIITLSRDSVEKRHPVHVLVAAAFIGPRPPGLQVCHYDGTRANNVLSNLRYDTRSENALDSVRHGTHRNAIKTHCKWGHEFTPENTTMHFGQRRCRICHRNQERDRHRRRRAAEKEMT